MQLWLLKSTGLVWINSVLYHTQRWRFRVDNTGKISLLYGEKRSLCLKWVAPWRAGFEILSTLDPHSILAIVCSPCGTMVQRDSWIYTYCCVRGRGWKMLSVTWWGKVDSSLQSNWWLTESNFIAFWASSSVLGRLCHTESRPERTAIAESHLVGGRFQGLL